MRKDLDTIQTDVKFSPVGAPRYKRDALFLGLGAVFLTVLVMGNTIGSMIAYLVAQTVDVQLFHFWKQVTRGRHLWLRNNGSTMVSQFVYSTPIRSGYKIEIAH
ncbi:MAG: queuosine precursor transporter [Cyclonatronaceae bacterium]